MPEPAPRVFVVSPHFDDAVFSCGGLLAAHPDAIVCTVFAAPPDAPLRTAWDLQCGFSDARSAVRARTLEDDAALAVLDAVPVRLSFVDGQYGVSPQRDRITQAIGDALRDSDADMLLMPLGLFHSDHVLVHDACRQVLHAHPGLACVGYEDALYRRMPGLVQRRLAELASAGIVATPACPWFAHGIDTQRQSLTKREAVSAYASQLRAFGPHGYDDVFAPERYWTLRVVSPAADADGSRRASS
jgi:LmbE family N-acetylglucosaminyl deacetylase